MYTVGGTIINMMLTGAKEIIDFQYPRILAKAGLSRFLDDLPSVNDTTLVATSDEVSNFYAAVYEIVGESIFQLFMRNLGHKMFKVTERPAVYLTARDRILALPKEERLEPAIQTFINITSKLQTSERPITKDTQYFYVTFVDCPYCKCINRQAGKAICDLFVTFYIDFLQELTDNTTIKGFESKCRASGDPECMLAIIR